MPSSCRLAIAGVLDALHLLDILAWASASGAWNHLVGLGRALLATVSDPGTW